jgi:hypothetical protein
MVSWFMRRSLLDVLGKYVQQKRPQLDLGEFST